jgi:Lanthionine synthetase C-like protein.
MEDIQKQLTDKLLLSQLDSYPVSLFHGKMGLVIYFYHLSKIESNPKYQTMADRLLDQILQRDLSPNHSIDVEGGLAGVRLGVTYLIKKGFVEGDINELLEVIDNEIYRSKGCLFHLTHTRDASWISSSKWHHAKARHDMNEVVNYSKEELYCRFVKK